MRLRTASAVEIAHPGPDADRHYVDHATGPASDTEPTGLPPPVDPELCAQFRAVLSALAEGQTIQRTPQRVVLASVPGEGEVHMLAATFAITCAANGYRVLLVDGNLQGPALHEIFGLSNETGLSTLLASSDPPHRLPRATAVPNLAVLTAGPGIANAASLLSRERVFHRLEPLANVFDYIIIDCTSMPPSLVSRISAGADHMLIAAKEHVSAMGDLANMVSVLRADGFANPSVLMIA